MVICFDTSLVWEPFEMFLVWQMLGKVEHCFCSGETWGVWTLVCFFEKVERFVLWTHGDSWDYLDKPPIHLENNWSLKDFWRHGEIPKTIALNQQQNMCCLPAHEQETIMGHNVGQNQHKECVACTCKNRSYLNNDVFGRKTKNRHCQREIANQTAPRCGCLSTIWLPCRLSACGRELIALCPQPGTFSNVCFWRLRLPKSCSLHTGIATGLWSETTEHFSFHSHYVFLLDETYWICADITTWTNYFCQLWGDLRPKLSAVRSQIDELHGEIWANYDVPGVELLGPGNQLQRLVA